MLRRLVNGSGRWPKRYKRATWMRMTLAATTRACKVSNPVYYRISVFSYIALPIVCSGDRTMPLRTQADYMAAWAWSYNRDFAVDKTRYGRSGCQQRSHQAQISRRIFVLDMADIVFPAPTPAPTPTLGVRVGAVCQLQLSTVDLLPISRLCDFHVVAAALDLNCLFLLKSSNRDAHMSIFCCLI
ncbi:hypothetical protein F4860DRAFT_20522 [Xylaria cubensis]|nr:hypothetical protein F4860DRAFT_20522 [Xylaria cubensis]